MTPTEECPVWLGKGKRVHESFRDPAKAEGTEAERLMFFGKCGTSLMKLDLLNQAASKLG